MSTRQDGPLLVGAVNENVPGQILPLKVDPATGELLVTSSGGGGGNVTIVGPLGQAAMAASVPVVIASNQTAVPVSGPLTDTQLRASPVAVSLASAPTTAVTIADGADVTQGAKADAKSTATDTTPITVMSVLKQISFSIQAAASSLSSLVTNLGTLVFGHGTAAAALRVELPTDGTGTVASITTSVTPGSAAANLGKAEDGGHTTGDVGVFALAVRNDTPNAAVSNTNADYTQISVTSTGAVRPAPISEDFAALANGPQVKKYYTNAGAVTDGIVWSPAGGARWYVTDIFVGVSAASTVTLEDDLSGGDAAVWKMELAANSGWSHTFVTPLFSGEDAADLLVTTSAGNVYITVTGYEI